jgi:hypothetical protein
MVSGFNQKIPEPKNANHYFTWFEIKTAASELSMPDQDFSVKSFVRGNDVYVECYLKEYRFSKTNEKELATITVSIDGKKYSEQTTAAFIVKDVPNGNHTLKLDIFNESGEKTGLTREFKVHIQSAI